MQQQESPHLLLVDGMALLFRSFFATAASGQYFLNHEGVPTNGVQGFLRHTMAAISIFQPSHLAICWDVGEYTFRNKLFDGYKANRSKPAPELVPQFEMARLMSAKMGWKNYGVPGMEADDVIGSLIQKWQGDTKITVISGDKDLLQLLRPQVYIAFVKKGYREYDLYTEEKFINTYGITPQQYIDKKAFTGDASDGYPGVKGIGPKTARQFIQTYGSVTGVLDAIEELTPRMRKKIEDQMDMLLLSKKLATIDCHIEFEDPFDLLQLPPCTTQLRDLLAAEGWTLVAKDIDALIPVTCEWKTN